MNKLLVLFFAFGALFASAAGPVVFDANFLAKKDDRFAAVLHGKAAVTELGGAKNLRFLFLVPKLDAKFDAGFKSGLTPKPLDFLKLDDEEVLLDLLAFSDCKGWFAVAVKKFAGGFVFEKFLHGAKGKANTALGGVDELVDFLKGNLTVVLFKDLLKLLPSHLVVHKLHAAFAALL